MEPAQIAEISPWIFWPSLIVWPVVGWVLGGLLLVAIGWVADHVHMPGPVRRYNRWVMRKAFGPGLFEEVEKP